MKWQWHISKGDSYYVGWTEKVPWWRKLWYRVCERMGWKKPYFAMKDWKL